MSATDVRSSRSPVSPARPSRSPAPRAPRALPPPTQACLRDRRRRLPARRDRRDGQPQGAARRRHVVSRRPFAAGDGDHPQPRDDDDRLPARPERRTGQQHLRPHRGRPPRLQPTDRHRGHDDHRAAQRLGAYDGHGAVEGVPLLRLRRPGHAPLGALPAPPGHRARPRRRHHGRRAHDDRRVRPRDDVRQPRRRRPGRPLRPHRHHAEGRPHGGAGLDQRPGRPVRRQAEEHRHLGRPRW